MTLSLVIFLGVLALIIWQPRGLKIGTTAVVGAVLAFGVGVVSLSDILTVTSMVWDATLAFIGIIILSMVLDEIGFFEWAALLMARASGGSGHRLFINMMLLGAVVAAFFANDGAALILTPIILAKMRYLDLKPAALFAFLMAGGFIGDSASSPLIISNLTNIVTAGYFHIGFETYARAMFLPNMLAIAASIVCLWLFFRKDIPLVIDTNRLPDPMSVVKNRALFYLAFPFLGLLLVGYFVGDYYGLPVSVFALGGALLFLIIAVVMKGAKGWLTLKSAPWQIVWFSIGLYVVVYGLKNQGITDVLTSMIVWLVGCGQEVAIVGTGFMAAVVSSVMNNMPTVMIMDIAIHQAGTGSLEQTLAYANLLGCNMGPKMTPIGSLATLLWLHVLASKGVKIGWGEYMKVGLVITPPVLLVSLMGLL